MTECSPSVTLFPLPRMPVAVTADGGAITSDAGALLLRELEAGLGLAMLGVFLFALVVGLFVELVGTYHYGFTCAW